MNKRLTFFATLAVLLAIVLIPADAAKAIDDIIKGPYLQKVTPSSIVIMWETNFQPTSSTIDYGVSSTGENSVSVTGQYYSKSNTWIFEGTLTTNLSPNTWYVYTVTSDDITRPATPGTFYIPYDTEFPFRFVAYGDTRSQPSEHANVINGIINTPGVAPKFVLHSGDLVANGRTYDEWKTQFFEPAYSLMVDTPLLPVLGNHEYQDGSDPDRLWHLDFFSVGNNDQWFAFTYGGVRFIGLNTCVDYSPGSDQYKWLAGYYEGEEWIPGEFQSTEYENATWHIVYFHHAPYTSGEHGNDGYVSVVRRDLVPLFEENGVDIVFNGHDHIYEMSYKVSEIPGVNHGVYYVVTGGGGAPIRDVNVFPNPYQVHAEGDSEDLSVYHHCVIDVTNDMLTISARKYDEVTGVTEFHRREIGRLPCGDYSTWIDWGRPACWGYPRQCRGDADGIKTGPFWVAIPDLNLFRSAFNKTDTVLKTIYNGICADFDHTKTGSFRVAIPDLNIFRLYFNMPEAQVPLCDTCE